METLKNITSHSNGFQWIKGQSGNTYLCPVGAFAGDSNPSEKELERHCINESENPQND